MDGIEVSVAHIPNTTVVVPEQQKAVPSLTPIQFQFQTLTEALPQIVWSCDAEGRHDYFSSRWSEFTGIRQEEITEDTWKHLVYPEHQGMVAAVWENALRTGKAYDIDYRFRHHSGVYRWLRVMALPIRDDEGHITRWFGTSTDVHDSYLVTEERERFARELERIATEDQLTGVLTRRALVEQVAARLNSDSHSLRHSSLTMLDIDHFKTINDTYGHPVGDKVLAATAAMITAGVREQDLVGRLGGEEFAVFLPHCSRRQALQIAERIRRSVEANPVAINGGSHIIATVSIGVTSVVTSRATLDRLLSIADQALYNAKFSGRNRVAFAASPV